MPVRSKDPAPVMELPVEVVIGPTGPVGDVGPLGYTGMAGPETVGPVGPTGLVGFTGPTGRGGFTGPTGPRGAVGPMGAGVAGPVGIQGVPGETGPAGTTGPTGTVGRAGVSLSPTGATGPGGSAGQGSVAGVQVPFFVSPDVYLTYPFFAPIPTPVSGQMFPFAILLFPVLVPYPRTYTTMVMEVATADPLGQFRFGIYDCTTDMHPTTPLCDSGVKTTVAAGRSLFTFNVNLGQRPYFMAYWGSKYLFFKCVSLGAVQVIGHLFAYNVGASFFYNHPGYLARSANFTGAALPDLTSLTMSFPPTPPMVWPLMGIR